MDPFTFYNPTHFVFGRDAETKVGESAREAGATRVLLVSGQGSAERSGLLERVLASLSDAGISFETLKGIKPNPLSNAVRKGITLARDFGTDAVMGVGGGSALDTAKAIAVGVPYAGDFWDFYSGKAKPERALKIFAVPTIAASGSESSNSSVITNEEITLKRGLRSELIRPQLALMNPALTFSVPTCQKAYGAADIMSHIFERYFTKTEDVSLTDELCEGVLRVIVKAAPRALSNPEDYAAHADLMWAGTLAHNDTLSTGRQQDWSAHALSHGVSAHFDAPHGAVLAVLFPKWMAYQLQADPARFTQFAVRVMGCAMNFRNPKKTALDGIAALEAFHASLGLPATLAAFGVTKKDLPMLRDAVAYNPEGKVGFFRPLDKADVQAIYEAALG